MTKKEPYINKDNFSQKACDIIINKMREKPIEEKEANRLLECACNRIYRLYTIINKEEIAHNEIKEYKRIASL